MGSKVERPILVTGAAGRVGAVGRSIVKLLRQRGLQVRALVRRLDERADALHATGAEVVVGDPGRAYLPRPRLVRLAAYDVPVERSLEGSELMPTTVWRLAR